MIEVKVTGANRAKMMFKELAKRVKDLRPIFKDFVEYYKDIAMGQTWSSYGRFQETKWPGLTEPYKTRKRKKYGSKSLLVVSGKMKKAAEGGAGFNAKIKKKNLEMSVTGEDYYYWTQHRRKNPRHWFYTPREELSKRSWKYLLDSTDNYLEEVDK